jgi:hypothetical protein
VLCLLGALVEQSLVQVQPRKAGGEVRYGMLEPVRQYAHELLEKPRKQGGGTPPFSLTSQNGHTVSLWAQASSSGSSA